MDYWDDEFEWDEEKNRENFRLHKIDFDFARLLFESDAFVERIDDRHDYGEERLVRSGLVSGTCIVVTYVFRDTRRRLISARLATRLERHRYAETDS